MENKNYKYDYLIIGTGSAALTAGALLANAGKKILMLEAHDIPGGYAQSFRWGEFYFCGQVHYIWGCGKGGKIYEFLKKIGLEKDITFELFDKDGYDHTVMPDGKRVRIPYGFDRLAENIDTAYPGQKEAVKKFVRILNKIRAELRNFPNYEIKWWEYITKGWRFLTLLKYRDKTLQEVFDECGLSKEAQAVLIAEAGNFMASPKELSIFAYAGLFCGYNGGAYYPTKHFRYYIDRLAKFISEHKGCRIIYNNEVIKIETDGDRVTGVITKDENKFTAENIICNMDPQKASELIGQKKFPKDYLPKISYKYSPSGVIVYLGLKDIDLAKYGFGKHNIWHMEDWDMNDIWDKQTKGDFSKPWVFISTPTLHSKEPGVAPLSHEIMEIETYADYGYLKEFRDKDYKLYEQEKNRIADKIIDVVEQKYVPNLRDHIVVKAVGSPITNESYVGAPFGNAYGSHLTPAQIGIGRLKAKTPWKNFFWCNASSGYGGVYGTVGTGMQLYMDLTGDEFFDQNKAPTDDEFVKQARRE